MGWYDEDEFGWDDERKNYDNDEDYYIVVATLGKHRMFVRLNIREFWDDNVKITWKVIEDKFHSFKNDWVDLAKAEIMPADFKTSKLYYGDLQINDIAINYSEY